MIAYTRALVLNGKKGIYYKVQSFTEVRLVPEGEVYFGVMSGS
jgi:CRISPR/Cas system-associated protein Csm6